MLDGCGEHDVLWAWLFTASNDCMTPVKVHVAGFVLCLFRAFEVQGRLSFSPCGKEEQERVALGTPQKPLCWAKQSHPSLGSQPSLQLSIRGHRARRLQKSDAVEYKTLQLGSFSCQERSRSWALHPTSHTDLPWHGRGRGAVKAAGAVLVA